MNFDLGSIVPSASIRKWIYGAYAVLMLITGATQAGYASLELENPAWLTVAIAVLGFLGVAVGGLAIANTQSTAKYEDFGTSSKEE